MGKIGLLKLNNQLRKLAGIPLLLLFSTECIEVAQAVIFNSSNQIGLRILDLGAVNTQPLQECILNNVFRVLLAAHDIIGN
jgi:hypothetical protein